MQGAVGFGEEQIGGKIKSFGLNRIEIPVKYLRHPSSERVSCTSTKIFDHDSTNPNTSLPGYQCSTVFSSCHGIYSFLS